MTNGRVEDVPADLPRRRIVHPPCRSCEAITQPPAPFHAIARGFAGQSLLAMILVDKRQLSAAQPAKRGICS
jgi:transposase